MLDFSYNSSGSEIVLSAVQKGQSDIFSFSPRTKTYTQITKDRWDDLAPKFVMDDRYIIFSSTRSEDTLRPTPIRQADDLEIPVSSDIFLYDYMNKSAQLLQLTNTYGINETEPMQLDSSHFSYLSDENGIKNRYTATLDSAIAYIDTVIHYRYIVKAEAQSDYKRNVLQHDLSGKGTKYAELMHLNSRYQIFLNPAPSATSILSEPLKRTSLRNKNLRSVSPKKEKSSSTGTNVKVITQESSSQPTNTEKTVDSSSIDINNYVFQSDFPRKKNKKKKKRKTCCSKASCGYHSFRRCECFSY
ncbi:MAG: hypothetical protein IPK10_05805 [Bacteroidetes bacterium]|nr:hypothetical protein [Bacteroidota bacterium]